MFIKCSHLLTGVERDDHVDTAETVVYLLHGIEGKSVKGIDYVRHDKERRVCLFSSYFAPS